MLKILAILLACFALELFVKSSYLRLGGALILLLIAAIVFGESGANIARMDERRRFARNLPGAFALLDRGRQRPEFFEEAVNLLREASGNPREFDHFDEVVGRLKKQEAEIFNK